MDEGQRQRFSRLIVPHLDAAYNLARWLTRDEASAEDVTHEAVLRAMTFFGSFRGDAGRPWFLAIVRNAYFDWRRRGQRGALEEPFDEDFPDHSGEQTGDRRDPLALLLAKRDGEQVTRALFQVDEVYREVLVLRELEELTYKEIAAVVGTPVGTVMSRLARGRERLRAALVRETQQA